LRSLLALATLLFKHWIYVDEAESGKEEEDVLFKLLKEKEGERKGKVGLVFTERDGAAVDGLFESVAVRLEVVAEAAYAFAKFRYRFFHFSLTLSLSIFFFTSICFPAFVSFKIKPNKPVLSG
jgi:O-succinylbenzoate synthase